MNPMTTIESPAQRKLPDPHAAAVEACDLYREIRLNAKYYGARLHRLQRWTMWIEIAIAVSTAATVGSLAILSTPGGRTLLPIFALIAAVLGVMKPILNLQKRIERCSVLWAGHNALAATVNRILRDAKVYQVFDEQMERATADAHERFNTLCGDDDPCPSAKVLERIQNEINVECPPSSFWCPPEITSPALATA